MQGFSYFWETNKNTMIYNSDHFDCSRCHGNGCNLCGGTGKSNVAIHQAPEPETIKKNTTVYQCPQIADNPFSGCGGEAYNRKISCLNCGFTWYNSATDHTTLCLCCGVDYE